MEYIRNSRGNRKLLYEGFVYILDKKKEETSYWRCERRRECSGRLSTLLDTLWQEPSAHSHPLDPSRVAVERAVSAMRHRTENSEESTGNIIQNCTQDFPLAGAGSLPKREMLARMTRRKRKAPDGDDIPDDICQTTRGEEFLALHDDSLVVPELCPSYIASPEGKTEIPATASSSSLKTVGPISLPSQ